MPNTVRKLVMMWHHDAAKLAAEELETEEEESVKVNNRYTRDNLDRAYDMAWASAARRQRAEDAAEVV